MEKTSPFDKFEAACANEGFLKQDFSPEGDDISSGISDDGTLLRFLRARNYSVEKALEQYKKTREWRDKNRLIELYDSVDVSSYEETRQMYTHWTGRRDVTGAPICLFEIAHLTSDILAAYKQSCAVKPSQKNPSEPEAMLRLFCTYENLVRFVMPLCSAVPTRPNPQEPIVNTTSIIDVSGVSLLAFWRLKSHTQSASVLATAHYPETLGRTYIVGAPSFFPTIWSWLKGWFDPHTVSKICIVPSGQELAMMSETIAPENIPVKYGGGHQFRFCMPPDLDEELVAVGRWNTDKQEGGMKAGAGGQRMPLGPIKWVKKEDGTRTAVAVGTVDGVKRNIEVMTMSVPTPASEPQSQQESGGEKGGLEGQNPEY